MARRHFATYAWFVLTFSIFVVLWGAGVRATGSGMGCGDRWPLCQGVWIPQSPQLKTIIEFTHRVSSGPVLGLLVIVLAAFAFRLFPQRHPVRRLAILSVAFTGTEALIGAALVLLGHVGANTSPYRALTLSIHLINTIMLLGVLSLTARAAGESATGPEEATHAPRISWTLAGCALLAFLTTSVMGAIAALGDTLFKVGSLSQGIRQDLSPSAHIFVRLRIWHPILAVLLGGLLFAFALRIAMRSQLAPFARKLALTVAVLIITQAAAGALNVLLLAPLWMQLVHLFIADLLWIALVLMTAELTGVSRFPATGYPHFAATSPAIQFVSPSISRSSVTND